MLRLLAAAAMLAAPSAWAVGPQTPVQQPPQPAQQTQAQQSGNSRLTAGRAAAMQYRLHDLDVQRRSIPKQ